METIESNEIKKGEILPPQKIDPATGRRMCRKPQMRYSPTLWSQCRVAYFKQGIWRPSELSRMFGITVRAIEGRMAREGWKKKLELQAQKEAYKDRIISENIDSKDIAALISSRKDLALKQLIESTASLLDKVHNRIRLLKPTDGIEITEMITALKNLQAMLDNLLGGVRTSVVKASQNQIQVNILAQVVSAADSRKTIDTSETEKNGQE